MERQKSTANRPAVITSLSMALMLLVFITGCDQWIGSSSDETGTMEVILHDNPGPYEELWVDVQRVEVNNQEDEGSGWVVINEPQQRYNLLELVNGAQEVLGEAELEEGMYRQIRLILGDDNELVVDGESYSLQTPSAQQTGLKLNIDAQITSGITYTLYLDFDASRSIVQKGNAQGSDPYLLKPVIRAYTQAETGIISGAVDPADADPWIYAIAGEDTVASTRGEENTGEFKLLGLQEDVYTVSIEPVVEEFDAVVIENVEVIAGEETDLGTIELDSDE